MRAVMVTILTFMALCFIGIHMTVSAQDSGGASTGHGTRIYLTTDNQIIITGTVTTIDPHSFAVDVNGVEMVIFTGNIGTPVRNMPFITPDSFVTIEGTLGRDRFGNSFIRADRIYVLDDHPRPAPLPGPFLLQDIAPAAGR